MKEIFDSALRRHPEERRRFTHEVCGGDKTLLAEVESLLSALNSAESFMETPSGRMFNLPQVIENNGEPWRARTSDPLIKSAVKPTPAGYGSYDLLTFVTGCSRQRVHLLPPINASFSVFWSQVGHKQKSSSRAEAIC
ncbi:MAG: hypothetical protein ACR2HX_13880 [Pyrinomonadaceae bacterium]